MSTVVQSQGEPSHAHDLRPALSRVLDLLEDAIGEAPATEIADLQHIHAELCTQLHGAAGLEDQLRLVMLAVDPLQRAFRGGRSVHHEREHELQHIVGILTEAVAERLGESAAFTAELLSQSNRLSRLGELTGLRELKTRLAVEVKALRETTAERQRRDDEARAHLTTRVAALQKRLDEAEQAAARDPLTGLANRLVFDRELMRLAEAARQAQTPLCVAVIDIDDFKRVNDTFGHPVGDRVLVRVARTIAGAVRASDVVARYGGEEFGLIAPGLQLRDAGARLGAILRQLDVVQQIDVDQSSVVVRVTASIGVADTDGQEPPEAAVHRADQALYDAKRQGKNRVVLRRRGLMSALLS
jgi:diguanylate cyclase